MTQRAIQTVDGVIDALGGTGATAKITARKPQHVSNWRAEKRIAAETYLVLQRELTDRKLTAPPGLWGIKQPSRRKKKKLRSS